MTPAQLEDALLGGALACVVAACVLGWWLWAEWHPPTPDRRDDDWGAEGDGL